MTDSLPCTLSSVVLAVFCLTQHSVHTLLQESWDSVYGEDGEGPAAKALRSLEEQARPSIAYTPGHTLTTLNKQPLPCVVVPLLLHRE